MGSMGFYQELYYISYRLIFGLVNSVIPIYFKVQNSSDVGKILSLICIITFFCTK